MSNVVHAAFGIERSWEIIRRQVVDGMKQIGAICEDDPALVEAKADRAIELLRAINAPFRITLNGHRPDVNPEHLQIGVDAMRQRCSLLVMEALADLITSKLKL